MFGTYESVLETIGHTPLVRLNRVAKGLPCPVYGKVEFYNPGASIKDRIGRAMIEKAEREGTIRPGYTTIVEATAGNTGVGLALVAAVVSPSATTAGSEKDIVDTAVEAGSFTTLAQALTAAGLVDTLKGPGPYTVFAPTDEAFAKLSPGTLDALLADKEKLTAVLTYHVVPGSVMAKDVKAGQVKTVQGSPLTISTDGGVKVDQARVVKTDIVADNGVIHVIDSVVLPN